MKTSGLIDLIVTEHEICASSEGAGHQGDVIFVHCLRYSGISDRSLVLLLQIKSAPHEWFVLLRAEEAVQIVGFFEEQDDWAVVFDQLQPSDDLAG